MTIPTCEIFIKTWRQRRGLAGQASPVPPAFHPDVELMAEHGRTLVPRAHRKAIRRGVFQSVPDMIVGSRHISKPTTTIPSSSYGSPRQRRSSRKSAEAGSHSHQSRLITSHHTGPLTNRLALMTDGDWRDGGFRQRRPSVETLAWVAASMGRGSRIVGYRRLTGGVCSAVIG